MKSSDIIRIDTKEIECGAAKPGAFLASFNINMQKFCKEFNERTINESGIVRVKIIVFKFGREKDRDFTFSIEGPSTSSIIKKFKGENNFITYSQLKEIVEEKSKYLEDGIESITKSVLGTIKSFGIILKETKNNE